MRSPVEAAFNAPVRKGVQGAMGGCRHESDDPGFCPAASSSLQAGKQTADYDGYEDKLRYSVPLWG